MPHRIVSLAIALQLVAIAGCKSPLKPVQPTVLDTSAPSQDATSAVARVLTQHGLSVSDASTAGTIMTDWQATNYRMGTGPSGRTAFIVRRFTVRVAPKESNSRVHVGLAAMKCEDPGLLTINGSNVHAGCTAVEGVSPADQQALNALGSDIHRELSSTSTTTLAFAPAATAAAPTERRPRRPLYKRWWFWLIVGASGLVVLSIALDAADSSDQSLRALDSLGDSPTSLHPRQSGGLTLRF